MSTAFWGYAKFATGDAVMGNPATLDELLHAYDGGANDLVAISEYGPDDPDANWVVGSDHVIGLKNAREYLRKKHEEATR